MTIRTKQQAITYVSTFDPENMAEHGFTTEAQQRAVVAYTDFLQAVKQQPGNFGAMIFLVSEADLLGHRPMTIWSNLADNDQTTLYEDYFGERLKMRPIKEKQL